MYERPDNTTARDAEAEIPAVRASMFGKFRDERNVIEEQAEKNSLAINAIVREFHEKMPREQAKVIGGVYARSTMCLEGAGTNQIRTLFEVATRLMIFIPREHVFLDIATTECQDHRPGLTAMTNAIARRQFSTVLVLSADRLFRCAEETSRFIKQEIVGKGVRVIFPGQR
jgi:predicted site-specific integrase-resolvase